MANQNLLLATAGEDAAVRYLQENGFKIIVRNYRTGLGEVDIIACDRDTVCFIEVKTRSSGRFGLPKEAVSAAKQRQISKAALQFLKERNFLKKKARFDVVSIFSGDGVPQISLLKNAFELDNSFLY